MLGETYEYVGSNYKFLAEQVSHHPPFSAYILEGDTGYKMWSNTRIQPKFHGTYLSFTPTYDAYTELLKFEETYRMVPPTMCVHNLILGKPYIDIGGTTTITNLKTGEYAELNWQKKEYMK